MRNQRIHAAWPTLALVLTAAAPVASAPATECIVGGQAVSLEKLTVHPAGAEPFEVGLHAVPAQATLPSGRGAPVRLQVRGAIAFEGFAKNLWLSLASPVDTGQLRAVAGAHVVGARREGAAITGSVVMYADDVLQGEDKQPDETAGPVRLECGALTLDWSADDAEDPKAQGDGTLWKPRRGGSRMQLRSRPEPRAPALEVVAANCEGCLAFERLEEKSGWLRVARTGERVVATGWIEKSDVEQLPDGEGILRSYGCYGGHGGPQGGFGRVGDAAATYEGPARIAVGTAVHAAPGRGAWATVLAEEGFVVRHVEGQAWVELTSIPGLVGVAIPAFVPASAVVFPPREKQ